MLVGLMLLSCTASYAQKLTLKRNLGTTLMGTVRTEVFSPDKKQIAAAYSDGVVRVWDIENTLVNREFLNRTNDISKIAFSPDSKLIGIANNAGEITIYNIEEQKIIGSYQIPARYDDDPNIHSFIVFLNNEEVLYGGLNNHIYRAKANSTKGQKVIYTDTEAISYGKLSNSGNTIAIGVGTQIKTIDVATGNVKSVVSGLEDNLHFMQFSGNGETLLYLCVGGNIGFVDLVNNKIKPIIPDVSDGKPIDFISYSTNFQYLTVTYVNDKKTSIVWDMNTRTRATVLHANTLSDCNERIDFTLPLTASSDNNILQIWQMNIPKIDTQKVIKKDSTLAFAPEKKVQITPKNPIKKDSLANIILPKKTPIKKDTVLAAKPKPAPDKVIADANNIPKMVNDRIVTNTRVPQKVKNKILEITVWDDGIIDGDIVSLNFNGTWVLENYELLKEKKTIKVSVDESTNNYLLMYAVNEGKNPPNTAVVTIFDGKTERSYNLRSNTKTCDSINILYTP
jgi:WD40 repeat protein